LVKLFDIGRETVLLEWMDERRRVEECGYDVRSACVCVCVVCDEYEYTAL